MKKLQATLKKKLEQLYEIDQVLFTNKDVPQIFGMKKALRAAQKIKKKKTKKAGDSGSVVSKTEDLNHSETFMTLDLPEIEDEEDEEEKDNADPPENA